jgi:hypothetical protein
MRGPLGFLVAVASVVLLVLVVGLALAPRGEWVSVVFGAGMAGLFQLLAYWLFSVQLFPDRPLAGYAGGMIVRFVVVGLTALVAVMFSGLAPIATLLSLLAVFFVTSVVEPVFHRTVLIRKAE